MGVGQTISSNTEGRHGESEEYNSTPEEVLLFVGGNNAQVVKNEDKTRWLKVEIITQNINRVSGKGSIESWS